MKLALYFFFIFSIFLTSCRPDDDGPTITLNDRGEEATIAQDEIEAFLQTHFYNYEDFQNPPEGFNFNIVFDSITGDNANKIPLIEQVSYKTVKDRREEDLTYKLYYLKVDEGVGDSPEFPDIAIVSYEGRLFDGQLFDSSTVPISFDLTGVIDGFQDGLIEFNGAGEIIKNNDGTLSFEDFGVGAVFIPSGLGYFNSPPFGTGISPYEQIYFTFKVFEADKGDQDNDGILSIYEDRNNDRLEENDDTDGDGVPDFADNDDDGDGTLTIDEIRDENGNVITDPALFPDADGDGTPDYLDSDN